MKLVRFAALAFSALALPAAPGAFAQDYPTRPIELLVAFPAGGGSDALARAFADSASRVLPQPMIVINKPGAAGTIGFAEGANAKPDGYKITMVSPELLITPYLGIGKVNYEAFKPIGRINADPCTVAVKADAKWKSIEEFIAHLKANPGRASVANSGAGSINHVCAAALEDKTGTKVNHIPYLGAGPTINALMGDQVDAVVISPAEVSAFVKSGKMRLLAVMAKDRSKDFPEIPTFRERGIDLVANTWRGLVVPKATPDAVVARLGELLVKVNADPAYRSVFERQTLGRVTENGEQFASYLKQEDDLYKRIVPLLNMSK
ncbi:tripartite tricarboxylate transporter substrate binding protein [Variovorax sp. KK3]|uniref:tripartite tricarboxylate transporter substrate binding protein n=1 Tax=Variovorax sp. KK3 TaxID=1855728 RepID=UPI00097C7843|nr:tripartite tricarboxylate transporter substrate binding protein [Variovorax sp. KK3]